MGINMTIDVSVSGTADFNGIAERVRSGLKEALLLGAEAVADCARGLCPVDTGRLQASISTAASGDGAVVYAGEDYGIFVEFGTYKAAAQPFLAPALTAAEGAVTAAVLGGLGI